MLFRIAIALGRTVAELEAELAASEFSEWCAFYSLEPWGFAQDNWRAAMIGSTIANFVGNQKKKYKIADFMPQKTRRQTPEQMLRILRMGWG